MNEKKSAVARPEEVHFLGFTLFRYGEGRVGVHLSKRSVDRLNARVRELTPRTWGQTLERCFERLNCYLRGWLGYFQRCDRNGAAIFRRFDAHIRRRLRAIILRQKKRCRTVLRDLLSRGVSRRAAKNVAYSRRGPWYRSWMWGMHNAYNNAWFLRRLVSLWSEWEQRNAHRRVLGQLLLFDP